MSDQVITEDTIVPDAPAADTTPKHPITEADPEGDGLDKGQATADVHGDVLGI